MLRINLLPPYIYEGSKRRNVVVLWIVMLALVIGGFVYAKMNLDAQAADWQKKREALDSDANLADKTEADAQALFKKNAELKAKADFVREALKHTQDTYPLLFDNVKDYTIQRVLYYSIVPSNQTVTIAAYAPSLSEVGHYMMAMEQNPNISSLIVAMNSVPSFPVTPQAPTQGGGGSGGGGGEVSSGGPPGGLPGPASGGMGGQTNAGGRGAGGGGAGTGGSSQSGGMRPPPGTGHDFTVTLNLLKPVDNPPSYPPGSGGGGQTGGAPAGGGMGGASMGGRMGGGPSGAAGGGMMTPSSGRM